MTHEFESGFFVRQPAWHRLGVTLHEAPNVEDAIRLAGLDWRVRMVPLFTEAGCPVPTHRATVRESDGKVIGVVGSGYTLMQNDRAFSFFEPFLSAGACSLEAAGSLKEGKRIWVLARINGAEAEVVDGDPVRGYFLLSNAHDASQAVRAQFTSIRVVCANTLNAADRRAERGFEDCVRVRHTTGLETSLVLVQHTIDMAAKTFSASLADYQRMVSRRLPVDGFRKYVIDVLEVPESVQRMGKMPKAWDTLQWAYHAAPGARINGVFGTYWGAYNAITDWVDHTRGVKDADSRLDSAWFGSGARLKQRAFELALP
ncbi:DUF932 domain-containing protein [Gemmata obscuriglobus]|nr:DUF932 domain-containing protein [Gemmata obscuriglobus]